MTAEHRQPMYLRATKLVLGLCTALILTAPCINASAAEVTPLPSSTKPAVKNNPSPIIFSFATVGDSRQQPNQTSNTEQDERWLQSTAVWSRMLYEIEQQKPNALVFNGDMIYGYTQDMAVIDRQYAFWRGMVAGLMARGTYVLPVPGNHETQMPIVQADGTTLKLAQVTHEQAWRNNMRDLILNTALWKKTAGVTPSAWDVEHRPMVGTDSITSDQKQLSYSFDAGQVHIVVINTDPVGNDNSAPIQWLGQDFVKAKSRGAKRFFVFGHKPAFAYKPQFIEKTKYKDLDSESGFADPKVRQAFWDLIQAYNATYLCGHQHLYHAMQPRLNQGQNAWQVIVGSAGTPLAFKAGKTVDPRDSMFAWALVNVRADMTAFIEVRGFAGIEDKTQVLERFDLN